MVSIKKISLLIFVMLLSACGYHLRTNNSLALTYPEMKISVSSQSLLKRSLISTMLSSGVNLVKELNGDVVELIISKDSLRKVIQSIGVNNQVQEYRLEYDVEYTIADKKIQKIHLEKDYSFDVQQIGGGQQEEITLRKQLAQDMAWAIVRQINASISNK